MFLNNNDLLDETIDLTTSAEKISEEIVAEAISDGIATARCQGQSLDDLLTEVLAEDAQLDQGQRLWLSKIVRQAWQIMPEKGLEN